VIQLAAVIRGLSVCSVKLHCKILPHCRGGS